MRPQRTMRDMPHLLCKRQGKSLPLRSSPYKSLATGVKAGNFAGGVELFYREFIASLLKTKGLKMEQRLLLLSQWGRRAEDPFRGLRAGPVRYSPFTFADRQAGHTSRPRDRKSTRLNSSHPSISYAVFC